MSFKFLMLIGASSLSVGCTESDDAVAPPGAFAMEAWIDNDGFPVVLLTRSYAPAYTSMDVADIMVRWAKVTISDGEREVVMTGGVDSSVFPPFSYRSYAMRGETGRTYTVTAEYQGQRAQATSTILPRPEITDITFQAVNDSVYSGIVDFQAPSDADTCRYVLYTRVRGVEDRFYPAFMGAVTSYHRDQRLRKPLYRGLHADLIGDYRPDFCLGDTVDVALARVEPVVYDFWNAYNEAVYIGSNIFISASNALAGNVVGGYGVFSARGVSRRTVVVGTCD